MNKFGQRTRTSVVRWIHKFVECKSLPSFKSFEDFVKMLHRPVDAASLGVCRMLFGFVMLLDIPEERGGAALFEKWGDMKLCHFPIVSSIAAMGATKMGVVYALMWMGAFGIFLGYKFRLSALMFSTSYWYIFLVDRIVWNNHSYLYGLCGVLFAFSSANRYCSVDSWVATHRGAVETVPYWNYFILKFQFFILYFVAGLKKMSTEWLSGFAMSHLSLHWIFAPFRIILGVEFTDLLIIHWFTCVFDLTIAIWLIYRRTRPLATIFCVAFHLMNSNLFSIGMFPWLCLTQLPLFFDREWPRVWLRYFNLETTKRYSTKKRLNNSRQNLKHSYPSTGKQRLTSILIVFYCIHQMVLPYSHSITQGYNTWTDGPYGYSWDMMIHAWDTLRVTVKIKDQSSGEEYFLNHRGFTYTDRWSKHADMAHQFANCLAENLINDMQTDTDASPLKSNNISIFLDVWCSLNGRFQQRIFDPNVDILKADWSAWRSSLWVLPIITPKATDRVDMKKITEYVHNQNANDDVIFVADFPGLSVEHEIAKELENVTLIVLHGTIVLDQGDSNTEGTIRTTLKRGAQVSLQNGYEHKVHTIGTDYSELMYTFSNRTIPTIAPSRQTFSINAFIQTAIVKRVHKYYQFIRNVIYSVAYEFGGNHN